MKVAPLLYLFYWCTVDISKYALDGRSREFVGIIEDVQERLKTIYGMKLVGIPDTVDFILVNRYKISNEILYKTEEDKIRLGLLVSILSMIFMVGHPVDTGIV